jgi:hypothetical protein
MEDMTKPIAKVKPTERTERTYPSQEVLASQFLEAKGGIELHMVQLAMSARRFTAMDRTSEADVLFHQATGLEMALRKMGIPSDRIQSLWRLSKQLHDDNAGHVTADDIPHGLEAF